MKKYLLAMLIATMFAFIGCTEAVTDTGDNDNTKTEETTTASYTVEHYQQNIENDEFTLVNDDTEEKSGKIGEDTKAVAKTYEGFTAKTVTQEKIADGGSTVVKIEYTRNVVTLTFDTDGGSEIESKSGKYGTELTVEAPTKEGYTFNSWNPALPTSFPAADTAYKAKWAIEGDYTITYELYEGTNAESNPVSYNVETATITLAEATKENYVFDGWYTDESFTDENKVTTIEKGSTGDITLYAKWIELITASNVAEKIAALTEKGTHTIKVTGTISSSTISEIKEALEDLDNGIYVNLDLSETTGLYSIENEAFSNCDELAGISIPDSVTSIGDYAFSGCSKLASIQIDENNQTYSSYSNCIYNKGGTTLYLCAQNVTEVTILDSTTTICDKAFYDCDNLTSVTIPDSVTSIGESAFGYCNKLTSVTISKGVTSIGDYAFSGCSKLTSIQIDENNQTYSSYSNCIYNKGGTTLYLCAENVTEVTILDSTTTICDYAFYGCSSLTSVTIPDSVTSIGDEAFYACRGLTSVTIPDSVTSISNGAFCTCTGLTSVTIPDSVTSIGSSAFSGCSRLTSVTIPDSVTSIGDYAFYWCNKLTSVTFADTSTWYYTSSSDYTDGTAIDVTDAATNATNLTSTFSYYSKYWYKKASSIE